jgi:osmotically-inducible protein OsmY
MTVSNLNRAAALALLLAFAMLAGCASTSRSASTGEHIDDTVITTRVKAAVFNDPELKLREVGVETFKGRVQLSGFVGTQAEINRATTLAKGVDGVTAVTNSMRLK